MNKRRNVVRVAIDGELLAMMVRGDGDIHYRLGGDIPADAVYLGTTHDPFSSLINLFFSHPSFPECEEAQAPVVRPISLTRID
jgi:hypothetical protein